MTNSILNRISKDSFFRMGYFYQMRGDLHSAAECYLRSIENGPNAEAHTFLGWVLSKIGDIDDAIRECKKAVKLDPQFGNAWNDIGAYLIEKRRYDDAIRYLKRACNAKNYASREFAHFNLGWIFIQKSMLIMARKELEKAMAINPGFTAARELLIRTDKQLH